MVQKKRKVINGKTYHLYRQYGSRSKAEQMAEKLKLRGIKTKDGKYYKFAKSTRIIKENLKSKKNLRPWQLWVRGFEKVSQVTITRQTKDKRKMKS